MGNQQPRLGLAGLRVRAAVPIPAAAGGELIAASPLELLHPEGSVERARVHGSGAAIALAPARAETGSPTDLVLLAPTREEGRSREWVRMAVRAAGEVTDDGLVVVAGQSRRLGAELSDRGLRPAMRLLHVPDVKRSRYVFPLAGPAARFALGSLIPLTPPKRVVAQVALPFLGAVAPRTVVHRRPGARPLLAWLSALGVPRESCTAIMAPSWRENGATVLHRFAEGRDLDAIVKVGGGARREAGAITALGESLRDGSVKTPSLLGEAELAGRYVAVESPVAGRPASTLLPGSPRRARELIRAVAEWLGEWNSATATERAFERADADRLTLVARRCAADLSDAEGCVSRVEELCSAATSQVIPLVSAHNDLTAANVLVARGGALGVVDWETAAADCLPLGDLAYAATDFVAAIDDHGDRPGAFAACFEPGGAHADLVGEVLRDATGSLGMSTETAELCLIAGWLGHADDERREAPHRPGAPRPFLRILERAVAAGHGIGRGHQ